MTDIRDVLHHALEEQQVIVKGARHNVHLLSVEDAGDAADPFGLVKITAAAFLDGGIPVRAEIGVSRDRLDAHEYLISTLLRQWKMP
jgi:hypothetical protein